MQVTETKTEGLLHEFTVAVPAATIEQNVTSRIAELAKTARQPGFRPGKVPPALLRKQYGASVMGEVLERTVNETSQKAIDERKLRPALQPKIEITKFEEGSDLEYSLSVEVMPEITPIDFSKLELERLTVKADEQEVAKTLERLAAAHKTSEPAKGGHKAKSGDSVVIDFLGKIADVPFAGGEAKDYPLELGTGSFIPGFEDQLIGAKAGDHVEVKVSFPKEYGAEELAGKDAVFEVEVKEVQLTKPAVIDDELAKKVGIDDLETLKKNIRDEHEREFKEASRQRLKRLLLDQLDTAHDFEIPQGLIEGEYSAIWAQHEEHMKQHGDHAGHDHDGKSDEELQADYREIAERRVRLGLLLAEIGRLNNIDVSQEDLNRGIMEEARRYPGQEQMVLDYFRNNAQALLQLKGPLLEDKVVDFVVELAKVTDKPATVEELFKEPQEAPKKKAAAKKPAAKKAAPKKAPAKKAADKKGAKDGE